MKYIASWSGGKDSTAMVDLLLRDKKPLDYIVFLDTTIEFKQMYDYIEKLKAYWEQRYDAKIVILHPSKNKNDFKKHVVFSTISRGKHEGKIRGFLNAADPFCMWRRDAKMAPFEKWVKNIGEYKTYIGFTKDETHRCKTDKNEIYPLVTDYKMSEIDCQKYLVDHEMENSLYRHFTRTGCRLCPYQSERDWYKIYQYFPDVWQELKDMEQRLNTFDNVLYPKPFQKYQGTSEYEKMFKGRQEWDFNDQPLKDCLCHILG